MANALCEKRFRIRVTVPDFPDFLCFDAAFDAWTALQGDVNCPGPHLAVTVPGPIPNYGRFLCGNMFLSPVAVGPDYGWLLEFGNASTICLGTKWQRVDPGPPPFGLPWILPQGTYTLLTTTCGPTTPVSVTLSAC